MLVGRAPGAKGRYDALPAALEQHFWCLTILSQCIQITTSSVKESIGGRRRRRQDDGVDDGWQSRDPSSIDGNDPWGLSSTGFSVLASAEQSVVIVRDQNTDRQGTEHIEEEDTPENTANSLGNVFARIFSLSRSNGDHFHTTIGESSVDECGPETGETTGAASADVLLHRTRILPVSETKTVVGRPSAQIEDEGQKEQSHNGDDLDTSEDEFRFAVDLDGEDVETEDDDKNNGDPCADIDILGAVPELDDDGSGRDFGAEGNGRLVPILCWSEST